MEEEQKVYLEREADQSESMVAVEVELRFEDVEVLLEVEESVLARIGAKWRFNGPASEEVVGELSEDDVVVVWVAEVEGRWAAMRRAGLRILWGLFLWVDVGRVVCSGALADGPYVWVVEESEGQREWGCRCGRNS